MLDRWSREMSSAGVMVGMDTTGFAMARPDAAMAPARPVFLRLGDLEPEVLADVGAGLTGADSFMDRRRNILRFLDVLPTEWTDAASDLSGALSRAELGIEGTVALVAKVCLDGPTSMMALPALIFVGDSTSGPALALSSSTDDRFPPVLGGDVEARSCVFRGGDESSFLSPLSLIRSPLRLDLLDLLELSEGVRCRSKLAAIVAERGWSTCPVWTSSRRFPVELEFESGRTVGSRSDIVGRLGVGVTASSSRGDDGGSGLLPSESVCWRRDFFDPPFISSYDGVSRVVLEDDIDMSLLRGDGGMTVTLGLMESVSVSLARLLNDWDGLWVLWLGLEIDIVGCGLCDWVGEVGEGDRAPSRFAFGLTNFVKKFGAISSFERSLVRSVQAGFRRCNPTDKSALVG